MGNEAVVMTAVDDLDCEIHPRWIDNAAIGIMMLGRVCFTKLLASSFNQ
jgi:hypothetical protein